MHRIALNKSSLIDKAIHGLESYTLVFTAIGRKSIDFFWLLLLSLLSHFLEFISLLLILKGFGLSCDLAVVWVISVLFHLLIQIPGPPGLIGLYELIGCFIFTRSGYLPGEAAAVTVILHLIITLRIIFGLLLVDGTIGLKSQARNHVKPETGQEFISRG